MWKPWDCPSQIPPYFSGMDTTQVRMSWRRFSTFTSISGISTMHSNPSKLTATTRLFQVTFCSTSKLGRRYIWSYNAQLSSESSAQPCVMMWTLAAIGTGSYWRMTKDVSTSSILSPRWPHNLYLEGDTWRLTLDWPGGLLPPLDHWARYMLELMHSTENTGSWVQVVLIDWSCTICDDVAVISRHWTVRLWDCNPASHIFKPIGYHMISGMTHIYL